MADSDKVILLKDRSCTSTGYGVLTVKESVEKSLESLDGRTKEYRLTCRRQLQSRKS